MEGDLLGVRLLNLARLLRSGDSRPSMKAALGAWGTNTNFFHQGVAKEVDDPEIIAENGGSFSGALSDQMGRSKNMPTPTHLSRTR
jgi:hypothetical protein